MLTTIDTSVKTYPVSRSDRRPRPASPPALSRTDYRRMVAEILG